MLVPEMRVTRHQNHQVSRFHCLITTAPVVFPLRPVAQLIWLHCCSNSGIDMFPAFVALAAAVQSAPIAGNTVPNESAGVLAHMWE